MKRMLLFSGCLIMAGILLAGCEDDSNGDENPVGTYEGTYYDESVTITTQFGSPQSASVGRSEDIPMTVTFQDDGQIRFSFAYSLRVTYTTWSSGAIANVTYGARETISDKTGPYADGAFDFMDTTGNAHITGTYGNGRVSGTITWDHPGTSINGPVTFHWVEKFSATKIE